VEFIPVADALARDPDLRFVATLPILGIPTVFESNCRAVVEVAEQSFGAWRALEDRHRDASGASSPSTDQVRIRVVVSQGDERLAGPAAHATVRHLSADDGRLIVHSAGSVAVSDPARRSAIAYVSTALVADTEQFRGELLEATTLALLSELDRHPVHAAAVANDGRAVLFAATSGTGKSTLAYVCRNAGLALMAEDRVYVQLEPAVRIWGWPSGVRLLPEVAAKLGERSATVRERGGKTKFELGPHDGMSAEQLVADEFTPCVLTRDGGAAALEPLAPEPLARALSEQLAAGFDRFPARWPAVVRALAARGGWRLNLSSDPMAAVPLVHDILRGVPA
jgi:hypothetical protein